NQPPPALDDDWNEAVCKGNNLVFAMFHTDTVAQLPNLGSTTAASAFQSYGDLTKWYYKLHGHSSYQADFDNTWGLAKALRELGVSDKSTDGIGGDIEVVNIVHGDEESKKNGEDVPFDEQEYTVNGKKYRATGAHLLMGMNTKNGVIITMEAYAARYAAATRHPPIPFSVLPALKHISDLQYLVWEAMANEKRHAVNGIHYILLAAISNIETLRLIHRALTNVGKTLQPWPGLVFGTGQNRPEGNAILASPHGLAVAFFLLQHRATLGYMYVDNVRVFAADTDQQ
ncbi:hypothetical protein EJ04DRAFT_416937, partial [Polyplosphaeria fusca]